MKNIKQFFSYFILLTMVLQLLPLNARGDVQSALEANQVKNYVTNGAFENGAARWSAYKNTAQTTPVTGSGGTPTTTITSTTLTPIAGKASGLIAHPASNTQGEGVSTAFTVDPAAKGRVLTITGLYQIVSGAYSGGTSTTDSDYEVYVYDVDAAQIIQPAGYKLDGGVAGISYGINATFQTNTTSTNYRLILHTATATASAFQLKVDSISVGVSNKSQGPPVTDPTSFVPTGATSSSTTYSGTWSRDGANMIYKFNLAFTGSLSGTSFTVNLPSGFTIDTARLPNPAVGFTNLGSGSHAIIATGLYPMIVTYQSPTSLSFRDSSTPGGNLASAAANDAISGTAIFPILGWSSNLTMSDSADTRVVAAGGYFNTAITTTAQQLLMAATVDTHSGLTGSNSYVVQVPGYYSVDASYTGNTGSSTVSDQTITITINGLSVKSAITSTSYLHNSATSYTGILKANDVITFNGLSSFGTSQPPSSSSSTSWNIRRLSGPSQIAASESVNARYTNSSGQSIPSATTTSVTGWTKQYDSHSAFNASTGAYTCPISGKYLISGNFMYGIANIPAGTQYEFDITQSGSQARTVANATFPTATNTNFMSFQISMQLDCLAGDVLQAQTYQSSGAARSLYTGSSQFMHLEFTRVGN